MVCQPVHGANPADAAPQPAHSLLAADRLLLPGWSYALLAVRPDGGDRRLEVFADRERLARRATDLSLDGFNVGVYLDPVDPAFDARRDRAADGPRWSGGCLGESDFAGRFALSVRVATDRKTRVWPSHVTPVDSAEAAERVAAGLRAFGFPAPARLAHGDVRYLSYWANLPPGDGRVRRFLRAIKSPPVPGAVIGFPGDAPRPLPWPGTLVRPAAGASGTPTPCELVVGANPTAAPERAIDLVCGAAPAKVLTPTPSRPVDPPRAFDLDTFVATHLPDALGPVRRDGGRSWLLPDCPWTPTHTDAAAFVAESPDGAPIAGCRHLDCRGHGAAFADLFGLFDPRVPPPGTPPCIAAAWARPRRRPRTRRR
ncbi:hypothetical protein [Alienimonas sp. DA493]|uniref:hypothetical protein n=1 Tax=Alienimonas sp. DA493 TaxID=3373605 RepID=UPI003754965D